MADFRHECGGRLMYLSGHTYRCLKCSKLDTVTASGEGCLGALFLLPFLLLLQGVVVMAKKIVHRCSNTECKSGVSPLFRGWLCRPYREALRPKPTRKKGQEAEPWSDSVW